MPQRIKRENFRSKLPPGTVLVARPSKWGNPFPVAQYGREEAISQYRKWITEGEGQYLLSHLPELAGKDLACYCELNEPCHGDVLLELAN